MVPIMRLKKQRMFNRSDLLNKCELKPNMIVKALESRLVKPVVQNMRMEKKEECWSTICPS